MTETMNKSTPFATWWQGGDRYSENISDDGVRLDFKFDSDNAMYSADIWDQLYQGIKLCPIEPSNIFGNTAPVNIEIGMGNGDFIRNYAESMPNENWVGLEVYKKIFNKAARKIGKSGLTNIRILQFDAALILRIMKESSINRVFVNFPDPWPKEAHKRRRLLKPMFIKLIADKLVNNGELHIATDHEGYAEEITENLSQVPGIVSAFDKPCLPELTDYFPTKYFRKFCNTSGAFFFKYIKS